MTLPSTGTISLKSIQQEFDHGDWLDGNPVSLKSLYIGSPNADTNLYSTYPHNPPPPNNDHTLITMEEFYRATVS